MYHRIVRRTIVRTFEELNAGNYEGVLKQLAPEFEHVFWGDHALAGVRCTMEKTRRWYERLFEVLPGLRFELRHILVKGMPWDTLVAVEWADYFTTRDGENRSNNGVHVIRIRWGRVVSIHVYCDTQKLGAVLAIQAQHGIGAAAAVPIEG